MPAYQNIREESEQRVIELQENIKLGELIEHLTKTKGWKLFEEHMMLQLHQNGQRLQTAADLKEVFSAQGAMNMINSLLNYTRAILESAEEAKQEIEESEK